MNDCQKTQHIITDAVDNRLSEIDRNFFERHIKVCASCRSDYELDSLTKDFIQSKITRHKTPENVILRINQEIERQEASEKPAKGFFARYPLARAAIIAMLVIGSAIVIYLLNSPDLRNTVQAADMMDQSIENYSLFLAGAIQPAKIGQSVDELSDFFRDHVDFPIALKPVKECEWVGGVLSDYEGVPLAHLVYKMPAGIIYVFQANWNEVRTGNKLSLSNGAITSLNQTGWYINRTSDDYSVVMWLYNDQTICTAVSSMEGSKLRDLFATETQQW